MLSPYASAGARLVDNGYSAIPIMPGTKRPGSMSFGQWYGRSDWQQFCDRLPTDAIEIPIWEKWADAGVCVAIDYRLKVIDIDTDDPAMMAAVLAVLPDSPVKKRGNKGFSAFYKGSRAIVSVPFSVSLPGQPRPIRVVDLLAHGRQTVLPPTIHPDTSLPYEWLTSETLIDTSVEQLPELPDDIADRLAEALAPFGFIAPDDHKALVRGDGDTLFRDVNDTALANLDRWVPALRLPGTKRHGKGYRAVAEWRGVEDANLSFHREGIKDWGNNESHTPIDIVMHALHGVDLYTATRWLCDQLGIHPLDTFDVAAFVARCMASQERRANPATPLTAPARTIPLVSPAEATDARIAAPRATVNPWDLNAQGGLQGEIARWVFANARRPVAEFATIAALSFLSAFYGRRYYTPTGVALNLYLIGIAGSGFGKDHPRRCVEYLGHDGGFNWLIGPNAVTSDSAIEKIIRKRPCFVMPWDEVGYMLQDMSGKGAPAWTKSVRTALLELHSKGHSIWTGKEHADSKSDSSGEPVFSPTVSWLGFATPSSFYAGISEANLEDGFMARLLIISPPEQPQRNKPPAILTVPPSMIAALKAAYLSQPGTGNMGDSAARDAKRKPIIHTVPWATGAEARFDEIETWQMDKCRDEPGQEGIIGRAGEHTLRLATIRALSRDAAAPAVSVDDIEWGYAIVQHSLDAIEKGVDKFMFGSEFEKTCKEIERAVERSGPDGIARSTLLRSRGIKKIATRDLKSALERLTEMGTIETKVGTTSKGGRPGVRYFSLSQG